MIASVRKERDGNTYRAVVIAHGAALREVRATQWCGTWERARGWAERYCKKNNLTITYSD